MGRADQVAMLERLVGDAAVVTVLGTGGVGKTRLAPIFTQEIGPWFQVYSPMAWVGKPVCGRCGGPVLATGRLVAALVDGELSLTGRVAPDASTLLTVAGGECAGSIDQYGKWPSVKTFRPRRAASGWWLSGQPG